MADFLKTLPKWLLVAIFVYVAILFSYAVYDNRSVQLFPPSISAKPPDTNSHGATTDGVQGCITKAEVADKYLAKAVVDRDYIQRTRFVLGEWRYFAIAGEVALRYKIT
jgi:hypothetical protein